MSYNPDITPIGGFMELELRRGCHYHPSALRLNTGCNALRHVLTSRLCRRLYLPSYICGSVSRAAMSVGVECVFYPIDDELRPLSLPTLKENDLLLGVNYFGLRGDVIEMLARRYGAQLIADNAQAFFEHSMQGVDTIYSPRKFFGVPDGAYLYCSSPLPSEMTKDFSAGRMDHLLDRIDRSPQDAYASFRHNEENLLTASPARMSALTEALLCNIDYEAVAKARRENFLTLHEALGGVNRMKNLSLADGSVPMAYPLATDADGLRAHLIEQGVFVPLLWPVLVDNEAQRSAKSILPLPIDQRYGEAEMHRVIDLVRKLIK